MSRLNVSSLISNSKLKLPVLTTSERDAFEAESGMMIFNSTNNRPEVYYSQAWQPAGADLEPKDASGIQNQDGLTAATAASSIANLRLSGSTSDGDYWIKPSGSSTAIQTYVNMSNAPSGSGYVMIARGRESTNWWQSAGQNYTTGGLTSGNLLVNTPISVAPQDWVNALIGGNWSSAKFLSNRRNSNDSFYFEGTQSTSFQWTYYQQSASSVTATAQRYNGLWKGGGLALNYGSGNYWTDTLNYGNGNNCDRTFMWSWSGHGSYQGWSGGSSCTPSGGFAIGGEGHYIQLVNVYMLIT